MGTYDVQQERLDSATPVSASRLSSKRLQQLANAGNVAGR